MKTKKESSFTLLPIDQKAFDLAVHAWRLAALHHQRVAIEHSVDHKRFRKLDGFDDVSVDRENESFYADQLLADAKHVLGRAAIGARPDEPFPADKEMFAGKRFSADTRAAAVADALAAVRKAMEHLPGNERFIAAMVAAEKRGQL